MTFSVDWAFGLFLDNIDEVMRVLHVIFSDTKIVNTKGKHCGSGLMFP